MKIYLLFLSLTVGILFKSDSASALKCSMKTNYPDFSYLKYGGSEVFDAT